MRILFYMFLYISALEGNLVITDVGIATPVRGDVGIIFFITLQNNGNFEYNIIVKMLKCCEIFAENDMDCQSMNLMGGNMGLLYPNVTKNISLIYPNIYLHNRIGQCLVSVLYRRKDFARVIKTSISFDTFFSEEGSQALKGYYNKNELVKCNTLDEDPLDNCEPINCHMKYLGNRNYFNYKWKRCQKVPICVIDFSKVLPDVTYVPISNRCKDLEDPVNVEDLSYLEKGVVEECWESQVAPMLSINIRCHHGSLNNKSGFCICEKGWMSTPTDKEQYEPSLSLYHMCNIKIGTWNNMHISKIKMTLFILTVLGTGFAVCLIILAFICNLFYKCMILKSRSINSSKNNFGESVDINSIDLPNPATKFYNFECITLHKKSQHHFKKCISSSCEIVTDTHSTINNTKTILEPFYESKGVNISNTELNLIKIESMHVSSSSENLEDT